MNASAFPGQTLAPIPLFNNGTVNSSQLPSAADSGDTLLQKIAQLLYNYTFVDTPNGSFFIPRYDDVKIEYYGATNNIKYQRFYSGGTQVSGGTLTYTYISGGAANDDLIKEIAQS